MREHFHRPDPSAFLADIARLERLRFSGAPSGAPGDIHVHFFADKGCAGADTLSLDPGDSIETAIPDFGLPLRNAVSKALPHQGYVNVEVL